MPFQTITNGSSIPINDTATSSSTIQVTGLLGRVIRVDVRLNNLSHTFTDDLDFLLVGPDGIHNLSFWSDVGGSTDVLNQTVLISDVATTFLPDDSSVTAPAYKPTDYEGQPSSPVETASNWGLSGLEINHPTGSGLATFASSFNGTAPNGTWSLYVRDDAPGDTGSLAGGWSLNIITAAVHNSFNGDLVSDILWRNADGAIARWELNGSGGVTFRSMAGVDANWQIAETGDFNNDGRSDILFRHTNGTVAAWQMNPDGSFHYRGFAQPDAQWEIAETFDRDGDGDSDILFRNADGSVALWTVSPTGFFFSTIGNPGLQWDVVGTGDFTISNGVEDILFRNTTDGTLTYWQMYPGSSRFTAHTLGSLDLAWQVEGVGDFNGDAIDDILFRHTDGRVATWLLDPLGRHNTQTFGSVDASWQIEDTADVNGDGINDILWRNNDGTVAAWELDGQGGLTFESYGVVANSWSIQNDPTFSV